MTAPTDKQSAWGCQDLDLEMYFVEYAMPVLLRSPFKEVMRVLLSRATDAFDGLFCGRLGRTLEFEVCR